MSRSSPNRTDVPYQVHAFEVSCFSAKVRPALRYEGLWYEPRHRPRKRGFGLVFAPA